MDGRGVAVWDRLQDLRTTTRARLCNIATFVEHRITNATSEGLNSAISTLIRRAYGYRSLQNQITAIYFHHGGLSLYPFSLPTENWDEPSGSPCLPLDDRAVC